MRGNDDVCVIPGGKDGDNGYVIPANAGTHGGSTVALGPGL